MTTHDSQSVTDAIRDAIEDGHDTPAKIAASVGLPFDYVVDQLARLRVEGVILGEAA